MKKIYLSLVAVLCGIASIDAQSIVRLDEKSRQRIQTASLTVSALGSFMAALRVKQSSMAFIAKRAKKTGSVSLPLLGLAGVAVGSFVLNGIAQGAYAFDGLYNEYMAYKRNK
jgi:hypothetical protein